MNKKLDKAAERAVTQALRLRQGESFLLVTDEPKLEIAGALARWARKAGAETTTYLMTEALRPIEEPTGLFRVMAEKADAVAYMLEARIEEKAFRGYMVALAKSGSRVLMMPGITVDMMERLVAVDYAALDVFTRKVMAALRNAPDVRISNADGTDIAFSVKGRLWKNSNGDIGRRGSHGNLPAGECYTCPVESTFSGKVAIRLIDDKLGRGVLEFAAGPPGALERAGHRSHRAAHRRRPDGPSASASSAWAPTRARASAATCSRRRRPSAPSTSPSATPMAWGKTRAATTMTRWWPEPPSSPRAASSPKTGNT